MNNMIGKFLNFRKESSMTVGMIYKITKTRIYCVDCCQCDRYITIEDFNTRTDSNNNKWFWIDNEPTDKFWYDTNKINTLKKLKNI